ncbi:MAG TPA: DUF47 family protein [Thermomicrobiaceae bacterium]|nr:DUF47 family protein [Thermomicrobiaceae bacterium]
MIYKRFLPRNEEFYAYFNEIASTNAEAAQLLYEILESMEDVERRVRHLRDLEHRADETAHRIYNALDSTFVTPIDREDIRTLTSQLDDFMDFIEEAGRRILLYRFDSSTDIARLMGRLIVEQAEALKEGVPLLEHTKQQNQAIRRMILEVNRLENEADDGLNQALGNLFDGVDDIPGMIRSIRWGEVYQILEDATDRAENVANTIEGITLKYA